MGMFDWLFGASKKRSVETDTQPDADYASKSKAYAHHQAANLVRIVTESIEIAAVSFDPSTVVSRLRVGRAKLDLLKDLGQLDAVIPSGTLDSLDLELRKLEAETQRDDLQGVANAIDNASDLESEGCADDAIKIYEQLARRDVSAAIIYKRLAINYRKQKRHEDELSILRVAVGVVPEANAAHHRWLADRLGKLERKKA